MNISNYLLPKNRNNPISFCTHKAKEYAAHNNPLVSVVAARAFAALTPVAAFACGINSTVKGLTHLVVSRINTKWAAEHMNSLEEIKTGLKCFVLVAVSVGYAAAAILIGSRVINKIPSPEFEFTYQRNRNSCIEMAKNKGHHHIIAHEGNLIQRPSIPFITRELQNETVEILWETYELAKAKNDMIAIEAIKKTIAKTHSTSQHPGWCVLKAAVHNTNRPRPANALQVTVQAIRTNRQPSIYAFSKTEVTEYLRKYYSAETIQSIVDFYTNPNDPHISTRLLHAILVGIQANLTKRDVHPLTVEKLKEMRTPLLPPQVYYSDQHFIQLRKDMYFLSYMPYADCYKPLEKDESRMRNFRDYGFSEYLARFVAYPLFGTAEDNWSYDFTDKRTSQFVKGTLFSCYHEKSETLMSIESHVSAPGLRMVEVFEINGRFGATVFRGTSDISGLKRDFEFAGVGRTSFEANKSKMLEVFQSGKKPEWHLIGHSLGAADAQRYLHALVSTIPKVKLPKLHLWTFNSPRIEHDVADDFLTHIQDNKKISIRHSRTLGDYVQFPGKILLGDNAAPGTVDTSTVFVAVPWFIRTWRDRHTTALYSAYISPNGDENLSVPTNFKTFNKDELAKRSSFKRIEQNS